MAAATDNRDALNGDGRIVSYGVASGVEIYAGTLVELDSSGYLVSFTGATTSTYVGVADDYINNTSTNDDIDTVENGGLDCRVEKRGVFRFENNGTPAVGDLGQAAYGLDDQTVGNSIVNSPQVGTFVGFGSSYFDVRIDLSTS